MPPPQHTPALPCDHCGYDLTGIAPDGTAFPPMIRCPECGRQSGARKIPSLFAGWQRFATAIACGVLSSVAAYASVVFLLWTPRGISSSAHDALARWLPIAVLIGGAVSMGILWRSRIAFLSSKRADAGFSIRICWFLVVDFAFYCVLIVAFLMMGIEITSEFSR